MFTFKCKNKKNDKMEPQIKTKQNKKFRPLDVYFSSPHLDLETEETAYNRL